LRCMEDELSSELGGMDHEKLDRIPYCLRIGTLDDGTDARSEYLGEVFEGSSSVLLNKQAGSLRVGGRQTRGRGKGPVPYSG